MESNDNKHNEYEGEKDTDDGTIKTMTKGATIVNAHCWSQQNYLVYVSLMMEMMMT